MNAPQREYFTKQTGNTMHVYTRFKGQQVQVCTVHLPGWNNNTGTARPWQVKHFGLQLAHGILCHHFALRRGHDEASRLASLWREEFADTVLAKVWTKTLLLDDAYINQWLVDCILDDMNAHIAINRRAANAAPGLN